MRVGALCWSSFLGMQVLGSACGEELQCCATVGGRGTNLGPSLDDVAVP